MATAFYACPDTVPRPEVVVIRLRSRRHPVAPPGPPAPLGALAPIAPAADLDPAARSAALHRLIGELNTTVESLWWEARWACTQLTLARNDGRADIHPCTDKPPAPYIAEPGAEEDVLRRVVDDLTSTAEALWWEAQWARAELVAAVPPEPRLGRGRGYG